MAECIILWLYMFIICLLAGVEILCLFLHFLHVPQPVENLEITPAVVAGITILTVYAECFSIFHGVKAAAHLSMLAVLAFGLKSKSVRISLDALLRKTRAILFSKEFFIILAAVLTIAFFSSRGDFHTDTKIYHAQAIRLVEEFGCLKGLGNIQLHFAYNSSALVFAALFSMSWILKTPLHGTTGFLMAILCIYSLHGVINVKKSGEWRKAAVQVGILVYIVTNLYYAMSPATDYFSQMFVLFILAEWCSRDSGCDKAVRYGVISLLAVFTVSLKLSAAAVVILALYPLILLIREKRALVIIQFVFAGIILLLPYLIRNIIISGWLLYPVALIDLFDFDWKVPAEYMLHDAAQIEVWGKCLYDVSKQYYPVMEWLPIWLSEKQHYEVMLLYAQILAAVELFFTLLVRRICRARVKWDVVIYYTGIILSLSVWFLSAPFIRYCLAYLLTLPITASCDLLLTVKCSDLLKRTFVESDSELSTHKLLTEGTGHSLAMTITLLLVVGVLFCGTSWIDNYGMDCLVFMKHHFAEPYYVLQKEYDHPRESTIDMGNGIFVYAAGMDEDNSYWLFPSTCYSDMAERSKARGERIQDGFCAR